MIGKYYFENFYVELINSVGLIIHSIATIPKTNCKQYSNITGDNTHWQRIQIHAHNTTSILNARKLTPITKYLCDFSRRLSIPECA